MPRATVEPLLLSGSTSGKAIKIAATASPGDLIHTAHATKLDKIFLSVYNSHTSSVVLTLQWGGTATPDDDIKETINFKSGEILVVAGRYLTGGLLVRAYVSVTNVLTIFGEVERVTLE